MIADFLCYLFEEKKLAVSTVEGYRTAISHTLKVTSGVDVGKDPHLTSLLANFQRDVSRGKAPAPEWDLALVLQVLTKPPFEPLKEIDLKHLTWKTVFLLTLASGQRRSEIHALVRRTLQRQAGWNSVTIYPDPAFIAKTQLAGRMGDVVQGVTIPALSQYTGPGMAQDLKLCPVRALKEYIRRTDPIRGDRKLLFLSYQKGRKEEVARATISRWLKSTILACYEGADEDDRRVHQVKAHQVRAMATSWAFHRNASMEKILLAGSWKSHTTFTSYYLRNLSLIRDEMLQLGPIVAALHVE